MSTKSLAARACALAALALLSGCGSTIFAERKTDPVIEEFVGPWGPFSGGQTVAKLGALGMTPERRLTIFNYENQTYCSEPSPDVAENLAFASRLGIEGQATGPEGQGSASGQAGISRALLTQAQPFFARSQGVQLFRDASFQYCQLYMNGAFGTPESDAARAEVVRKIDAIALVAERLILAEIEKSNSPLQLSTFSPADFATMIEQLEKLQKLNADAAASAGGSS